MRRPSTPRRPKLGARQEDGLEEKAARRSSKGVTGESARATPTATTPTRQKAKRRPRPTRPVVAIAYDFDGTLAPGNMQEHSFIPAVKGTRAAFWSGVKQLAEAEDADEVLMYMRLMLEKANEAKQSVHRSDISSFGANLPLFPGVEEWFARIDQYGQSSGVKVEHYIISSGIGEIVEGTAIGGKFKAIYASSFLYDHNDVAVWPRLALNYTTKTQYLFRINKGSLQVSDHTVINAYVPKEKRPVPFENIVYIGDGETDIPCFRLVKELGGHSIAVYAHGKKGRSDRLMSEGRISFAAPANYSESSRLDRIVKGIIDKISADHHLSNLGRDRA